MRAWEATGEGGRRGRVRLVERPLPVPGPGEVLVRVEACGVCRTDLHVTDGDLPVRRSRVVPGHEVVGTVVDAGPGAGRDAGPGDGPRVGPGVDRGVRSGRFEPGDRVGVAWLRHTCGECHWCRRGAENLCPRAEFTGWDHDGGYAEYVAVPSAFAYRVPSAMAPEQAAPLLCAGIIGYRALRRTGLPPGGRLGLYGFGASAHLTAQLALGQGAEVHVLTRGAGARELALSLGAASAGDAYDAPPVPLDAAVVFAPVGDLVPVALEALDRGGTLVLAGIHLTDVPPLDYQRHLFLEKRLTSVTANTRADGEELLRLAVALSVAASVTTYPFEQADVALEDLSSGRLTGVAVLSGWSPAG